MVTKNTSAMVLSASFMLKVGAVLGGTALGLIGVLLGDAIRKFALPDAFFTSGGATSIVKTKLFWAIGPQTIGVLVGSLLGASLVLS